MWLYTSGQLFLTQIWIRLNCIIIIHPLRKYRISYFELFKMINIQIKLYFVSIFFLMFGLTNMRIFSFQFIMLIYYNPLFFILCIVHIFYSLKNILTFAYIFRLIVLKKLLFVLKLYKTLLFQYVFMKHD